MNERIRKLAGQAGATTMQRSGWIDYGTLDLDVEKFAELIVRECAQACETVIFEGQSNHFVSLNYAWRVKQHFGVK